MRCGGFFGWFFFASSVCLPRHESPPTGSGCVYIYITGEGIFFDKFLPNFFTDEIVLQLPAGHVQQTYGVN